MGSWAGVQGGGISFKTNENLVLLMIVGDCNGHARDTDKGGRTADVRNCDQIFATNLGRLSGGRKIMGK